MNTFSIKELAQRIHRTQQDSQANITDRIGRIQERIGHIMENANKFQEFSKILIQSAGTKEIKPEAIAKPGAQRELSLVQKKNLLTQPQPGTALDDNVGNIILDQFLKKSAGSGSVNLLKALGKDFLPEIINNSSQVNSMSKEGERKKFHKIEKENEDNSPGKRLDIMGK
jgi:hypothetical protein